MKTFIRNLIRLNATYIFNIIGLSVAFASFVIILMQVDYDLSYDRCYQDSDKIFRMEMVSSEPGSPLEYQSIISRPIGEGFISAITEIESGCCLGWDIPTTITPFDNQRNSYDYVTMSVSTPITDVFNFDLVTGDFSKFDEADHILIPESVAKIIFQNENASGKTVFFNSDREKVYTVAAVYKDFPKNSTLKNIIFTNIGEKNIDNFNNANERYYYRLKHGCNAIDVTKSMEKMLMQEMEDDEIEYIEEFKKTNENFSFLRLINIHDVYFNHDYGIFNDGEARSNYAIVYSLISIALLILIIAFINFINFAMASIPLNIRKINTERVYGATRGNLVFLQIKEIVLLSVLSYFIALFLVYIVSKTSLVNLLSTDLLFEGKLNFLIICFVVVTFIGVIAALYPSFYSVSFEPAMVLKGSYGKSPRGRKMRVTLISFQYIISFILIITVLFIMKQNSYMKNYDLGFDMKDVLTFNVSSQISSKSEAFTNELKSNPDIIDVTSSAMPLVANGGMNLSFNIDEKPVRFRLIPVALNFIDFFDFQLVDGRKFTTLDENKDEAYYLFNETAKKQFDLELGTNLGGAEVIGYIKDFNFSPLQNGISPVSFMSFGKENFYSQAYKMRVFYAKVNNGSIKSASKHIENTIHQFDPEYDRINIRFMTDSVADNYKNETKLASLLLLFSFLSIFISLLGIMGLILFETRFRRKEIGLRRVFGSTISEILKKFNKTYLIIVTVCFAISIPIALYIIKLWVASFAYQAPVTAWIFILAYFIVVALTVIVISLQSYRAVSENPVESIKTD